MEALQRHHWPGNVRELRNVLERAVILAGEGSIELKNLPAFLQNRRQPWCPARPRRCCAALRPEDPDGVKFPDRHHRGRGRKGADSAYAGAHRNNKTRAAEILGISLKTLHNKLKEYGSKELIIGA